MHVGAPLRMDIGGIADNQNVRSPIELRAQVDATLQIHSGEIGDIYQVRSPLLIVYRYSVSRSLIEPDDKVRSRR
ncbi:hypothetical protein MC7420_7655 [Coleofasciculus chthonoplastes PCC 7420]|uniref:Uncharacterized protein n=2 Tax=Coleofasciculus chthonoplastes TaxID=64178 RepID=B4VJ18_9CYAN|nr:hypothetical protein MC7420_7655 [Coleofasciculus chthonoplastes PCC 7420]